MTEFQLEQTADWPSFVQVMSPARKFYVDNPDTLYHRATLDPRLGYRVRGRRGDELYLSFCVYGLRGRRNAILAHEAHKQARLDAKAAKEAEELEGSKGVQATLVVRKQDVVDAIVNNQVRCAKLIKSAKQG